MAALSSVPLQLGTRRRLGLLPLLLLLATALALVAVTVLLHFKAPSSSSWTSTSLVSPAAYIAGLVRTGAAEISHPVNNEWEGGIGPTDSFNWQRGSDGDLVQLDNGTTITYRNPLCVTSRSLLCSGARRGESCLPCPTLRTAVGARSTPIRSRTRRGLSTFRNRSRNHGTGRRTASAASTSEGKPPGSCG